MVASELRIGNWVAYPKWYQYGATKYFRVKDIYSEDDKIRLTDGKVTALVAISALKPITLTEERLLKCGFEKRNVTFKISEKCVICNEFKFIGIYIKRLEDDVEIDCPEYLHQLQNIHFALTGQELEIKL